MTALDDLTAAVAKIGAAVNAAVADIQDLTAKISAANAANDSVAIEAAVSSINASADALSAAVAASTTPPPAA